VTIVVRPYGGQPACWNDIADPTLGGRYWESTAHAPESWGTGPVTGTFRVVSDGEHHPLDEYTGNREAVFTADQGGRVNFFGGTAHFFDDLTCAIR
jgi:hypothetical protein